MEAMITKYGIDLASEIADAKTRDDAVLVINLAADEPGAPINTHLVKTCADKLKAAAKEIATEIDAKEIIVVAPDNITLDVNGAKQIAVKRSLVLREESALFHIISTGEISCPIMQSQIIRRRPRNTAHRE